MSNLHLPIPGTTFAKALTAGHGAHGELDCSPLARFALLVLLLAACSDPVAHLGDGALADAQPGDAALPDAALPDAALPDAALPDAALPDAALPDAALPDAAPPDAASPDAALPDAALPDAALPDAALPDAGSGTNDIWVEIDYSDAYSPSSPDWLFSATPGWGAAQWGMSGDTWPEAWDRWNNMTVGYDPIGTSLLIGSSGELQLMFGLEELLGFTSIEVHLEGRSASTSSSVVFDVTNPLLGCGVSGATMANDWSIHAVDLDLADCAVVGTNGGVQAIRVETTGGSGAMALVRMRVTIRGAIY
jgi:hypothetical protein